MRILIVGGAGQIGSELCRAFRNSGHELTVVNRQELDVCRLRDVGRVIRRARPQVLINATGYTQVDLAESEREACRTVNALAPAVMAEEMGRLGGTFVHYSSDYVFDGRKDTPYTEEDVPNPVNEYGRSKLEGEVAIRALKGNSLIFRTSWIYSGEGRNFVTTLRRLAQNGTEIRVVSDQIGSPTWAREVAAATKRCLEGIETGVASASGLYHLTAADQTSWFGFAQAIAELDPALRGCAIRPVPSSQYPAKALRPTYSVLANHSFHSRFGFQLDDWRASFQRFGVEQGLKM